MLAQSRTDNQQGLCSTWMWAQEAHSDWRIRDPECCSQLAQGLAAVGGDPVQGLPTSCLLAQHLQSHMHQHQAHGQHKLLPTSS